MPLLYDFDFDTPDDLLAILANNMQKRRLEKGFSREALTELSGVPTPTIAKFEQKHTISLASFVALAKVLGYSDAIRIPRKKGRDMISSIAEGCSEIVSTDYILALKEI